jgi:hypothetical protein
MQFYGEVAQASGSEDPSRARTYKIVIVSETTAFAALYATG